MFDNDFNLVDTNNYTKGTELKGKLLANLRPCLSYLLPSGKFKNGKFYVGDVKDSRGDSLVVDLTGEKSGLWQDFATKEGGDIFSLWAAVKGKNTKKNK